MKFGSKIKFLPENYDLTQKLKFVPENYDLTQKLNFLSEIDILIKNFL